MKKRSRELIQIGLSLGFELLPEQDSRGHWVLVHPNGRRVSVSSTPSERRGDRNAVAQMERASTVKLERPHRRGDKPRQSPSKRPASVVVEADFVLIRAAEIELLRCEAVIRGLDQFDTRSAVEQCEAVKARAAQLRRSLRFLRKGFPDETAVDSVR